MATGDDAGRAELDEYAQRIIVGWPPLTDEQLDRCAHLLQAGARVVPDR